MARAVVFVDDAVLGRLPAVCVKTGAPADGFVEQRQRVRRAGPWVWLLLFLGPIGWLAIFLIVTTGGEPFTVRVPVTNVAFDRWRVLRRLGRVPIAVAVVTFALLAGGVLGPRPAVIVLGVSVLAAVVLGWLAYADHVGVELDASGRWVTLTGVAPAFADAVAARQAADPGGQRVGW